MKIYIYDCLNKYGKPLFKSLEISEEEAKKWEEEDYRSRLEKAEKGINIERRSAQSIQDEIDREYINSDRKEYRHRVKNSTIVDEEGNEIDIIEIIVDHRLNHSKQYEVIEEHKEVEKNINRALNLLSEIQRRRIVMRYVENKKLREIAEIEGCDITSVRESINSGIIKIKKFFKKTPPKKSSKWQV